MRRPSLPPLLRASPAFRSFWIGQTISLFGDEVSLLAVPLLAALTLDAGPGQMGLLSAASLLPNLLFSLHLGVWTDRRPNRRGLMVACDLGRAGLLLTIPAAAAFGVLSFAQLYVVAFAVGTLAALFSVAYEIVFVSLVERDRYIEAGALLNGSRALSLVGGTGLAGVLVQLLGAPLALLADAGSFLGSPLFVRRAEASERPAERREGRGLAAGARFIARTPLLRASLLAAATLNLFNAGFWALLVLFATGTLGIGAAALGLALSVGALGSVLGTVATGPLSRRLGLGNALVLAFVVAPAPLLLVPLAAGHPGAALLLVGLAEFGSGFGCMVLDVGLGAMQTALIPDRLRARVAGAYRLVNYGVRPLGALAGGLLAGAVGLLPTMWVASAGALAGVLWLLPSPLPRLRALPDPAPDR